MAGVRAFMRCAIALLVLGMAGCGADEPRAVSEATGFSTTTQQPTPDEAAQIPCDDLARVSSSHTDFDPASGTYPALVFDMTGRSLRFDVVQWLSGPEADEAYQEDEPGSDGGPPNDYFIRNSSPEQRTAVVDEGARVELVRLAEDDDARTGPGTVAELPDYIRNNNPGVTVYWLGFENGVIKRVCEQYRP